MFVCFAFVSSAMNFIYPKKLFYYIMIIFRIGVCYHKSDLADLGWYFVVKALLP
jgi:hypothetical protein